MRCRGKWRMRACRGRGGRCCMRPLPAGSSAAAQATSTPRSSRTTTRRRCVRRTSTCLGGRREQLADRDGAWLRAGSLQSAVSRLSRASRCFTARGTRPRRPSVTLGGRSAARTCSSSMGGVLDGDAQPLAGSDEGRRLRRTASSGSRRPRGLDVEAGARPAGCRMDRPGTRARRGRVAGTREGLDRGGTRWVTPAASRARASELADRLGDDELRSWAWGARS